MIAVILTLVIIGVLLYFVENYVPMAPPIKLTIRIVVIVCVILWLLRVFGITDLPVPQLGG